MARAPLIDAELAAFLEQPVAVIAATRDARMRPHLARAYAPRAQPDGRVCIHIPVALLPPLVADLEENGQLAVVFSRVVDFQTYQIKGDEPQLGDLASPAVADAYNRGLGEALLQLGTPAACVAGLRFRRLRQLFFRPRRVFDQTPGPAAGLPHEARDG